MRLFPEDSIIQSASDLKNLGAEGVRSFSQILKLKNFSFAIILQPSQTLQF